MESPKIESGCNLEDSSYCDLEEITLQEEWWRELKALFTKTDARRKEVLRQFHESPAAREAREAKETGKKPLSQAEVTALLEHRRKVQEAHHTSRTLRAFEESELRRYLVHTSPKPENHHISSGSVNKSGRLHHKKMFIKPKQPKAPVSPFASLPTQSILCTQSGSSALAETSELDSTSSSVTNDWHLGLDCDCGKIHIGGSVWASVTQELQLLVRVCRESKWLRGVPGVSVYRGHPEFVNDKQSSCTVTSCPACLHLAGIRRFVAHTLSQAEALQIEAMLLLASDFFPLISGELGADNTQRFDTHSVLAKALKTHPYRLSAYQAMMVMMGRAGNDDLTYPLEVLEYPEKLKVLCESWFSYTRQIFAPENLKVDHSDKVFMFDRVFAPNNQMTSNDESVKDAECMLCGDNAEGKAKLVRVPCGHAFCVDCLKKWRINSPLDENFLFQYRCPLCRKCLACGTQECDFHKIQMPELYEGAFNIGSIWPIPLESLLKTVFAKADDSLLEAHAWNELEPVRLMPAATYIKLRENTRKARILLRYNLKQAWQCIVHLGEGPEYHHHADAALGLFEELAAEFRLATQHEANPHFSSHWDALDWCAQPFYPAVSTRKPRKNPTLLIGPMPDEENHQYMFLEDGDPEMII
ncbi:hypothetical protein PMIN04_006285 [Paraphaeosphaeria minitans]